MSLKTDIALLTLEETLQWLNISNSGTSVDEVILENWINSASDFIENYTGRKFITPGTAVSEIFNGTGTKEYYTVNRPIVTITSLSYWSGTAWVVTTGTYDKILATGRVYFTDGSVFTPGRDYWKIVYTYGYSVANVPYDLKHACLSLVSLYRKQFDDGIHGVSSRNFGDQSISYSFDRLPESITMILNKYKRWTVA